LKQALKYRTLAGRGISSTERGIQVISESTNSSIIPSSTVKCAMFCLLDDLPIEARDFGASPTIHTTAKTYVEAFERLHTAEQEVTIRGRFKQGDLWNAAQQSGERFEVIALIRQGVSIKRAERTLRLLRNYGCVARKWPEDMRSDKHGWTYYVKNKPGKPIAKDRPYGLEPLHLIDGMIAKSGLVLHIKTNGETEYVLRGNQCAVITQADGSKQLCELRMCPVDEEDA
jgi:hypothetical protein